MNGNVTANPDGASYTISGSNWSISGLLEDQFPGQLTGIGQTVNVGVGGGGIDATSTFTLNGIQYGEPHDPAQGGSDLALFVGGNVTPTAPGTYTEPFTGYVTFSCVKGYCGHHAIHIDDSLSGTFTSTWTELPGGIMEQIGSSVYTVSTSHDPGFTSAPEPSTLALMALSLVVLLAVRGWRSPAGRAQYRS